jgi:phosphoribosylanthranilate isomerase
MFIHTTAITSLTDARYFAAKEVNFLGFHLEESASEYLDPTYMKAIHEWVEGPVLTGWYFHTPLEVVAEAIVFFGLGAVVLDAALLTNDPIVLDSLEWHLLAAPDSGVLAHLDAFTCQPKSVILNLRNQELSSLNAENAGAGKVREICRRRPTILFCADLRADTLHTYEQLFPEAAGFCLSGAAEEKVGVKAFDDLEDLFDLIEERKFA